jgi:hypothetical protein
MLFHVFLYATGPDSVSVSPALVSFAATRSMPDDKAEEAPKP